MLRLGLLLFSVGHVTLALALVDTALFSNGDLNYSMYRIPGIVRGAGGVLLAFCEARKLGGSDHGWVDLALRRSSDAGQTWSPIQIVLSESNATHHVTVGNPAPVVDEVSGRVFLWFSRDNAQMAYLASDDNGVTWSEPVEMSDAIMAPHNWTSIFTGLSGGLTLAPSTSVHAGAGARAGNRRLIVCSNHGDSRGGRFSASLYSDDRGASWQAGESVGPWGSTECNLGQTDTAVFMYSRMWNQAKRPYGHAYGIARSIDGGVTFDNFTTRGIDWPQPDCEGTMRVVQSAGSGCFVLVAPYGGARANMTLSYSCGNEPAVWKQDRVLWPGYAAYSSMTSAASGTLFVLYERGDAGITELRLTQVDVPSCVPTTL